MMEFVTPQKKQTHCRVSCLMTRVCTTTKHMKTFTLMIMIKEWKYTNLVGLCYMYWKSFLTQLKSCPILLPCFALVLFENHFEMNQCTHNPSIEKWKKHKAQNPDNMQTNWTWLLHLKIDIIVYIYNALSDALSVSRIHKLKTILSKYIHIQNRQS